MPQNRVQQALAYREALFQVLLAFICREPTTSVDLEKVNRVHAEMFAHLPSRTNGIRLYTHVEGNHAGNALTPSLARCQVSGNTVLIANGSSLVPRHVNLCGFNAHLHVESTDWLESGIQVVYNTIPKRGSCSGGSSRCS